MTKKEILEQVKEVLELQAGLLRELANLLPLLGAPEEDQDDELLPVKDAASRLGLAESTLRRLIYQKQIRSTKIGGKILVPKREIKRLTKVS